MPQAACQVFAGLVGQDQMLQASGGDGDKWWRRCFVLPYTPTCPTVRILMTNLLDEKNSRDLRSFAPT